MSLVGTGGERKGNDGTGWKEEGREGIVGSGVVKIKNFIYL